MPGTMKLSCTLLYPNVQQAQTRVELSDFHEIFKPARNVPVRHFATSKLLHIVTRLTPPKGWDTLTLSSLSLSTASCRPYSNSDTPSNDMLVHPHKLSSFEDDPTQFARAKCKEGRNEALERANRKWRRRDAYKNKKIRKTGTHRSLPQ